MKQLLITTGLILVTLFSVAQKSEIYSPSGIAINGFDAVAFYNDSKAVKGNDAFSYSWKNANWLFSSQQNLDSFKLMPEKYEPAYGGYCAYGASRGYKAPTEADTWAIVENKLYFNYNQKVKQIWEQKRQAYIDSANAKWILIKNN